MGQPVLGFDIGQKLYEAGLVPDSLAVRRIVIDIPCDGAVTVYYETFADKRMIDTILESLLKDKDKLRVVHVEGMEMIG